MTMTVESTGFSNGTKWRHIDGNSPEPVTPVEANGHGLNCSGGRLPTDLLHFFTAEVDGRSYDFYANGWTDVEVETLKMSDLHKISVSGVTSPTARGPVDSFG